MTPPRDGEVEPRLDAPTTDLVEALVDAGDRESRARLLVRHAQTMGVAAALWVESASAGWRTLVARGPAGAQPDADVLHAVAEGALDPTGPGGRRVLVAGDAPQRRALSVVGFSADDEACDALEALVTLWALLGASDEDGDSPLRPFAP